MDLKPDFEKYSAHKLDTVVCFWDPQAFFGRYCSTPRCIECGSDEVESNGWPTHTDNAGFLPLVKTGGCDWLYAKNYSHKNYQTKEGGTKTTNFNTVHPKYLDQLPEHVFQLNESPFNTTHNALCRAKPTKATPLRILS
jgi:hypothetical protein